MKYGQQLEYESVPEWSLHNVDYNSLKREIKTHTSRDQATAIAIPGQEDTRLKKFEEGLYEELCRQHERVDLFVTSKGDEVRRRLEYLVPRVEQFVRKCGGVGAPARRRKKFEKLERELLRCGDDLAALRRFTNAQVVAFRKILKKYRKWTGSAALGERFRDDIVSHPKSFTRRSFSDTQTKYDSLKTMLRTAAPEHSEPSSPESDECPHDEEPNGGQAFAPLPPPQQQQQNAYWNEYDYGSEAGGDEGYAIYIDPDEDDFPGLGYVRAMIAIPFLKARGWFSRSSHIQSGEHDALLPTAERQPGYSTTASSFTGHHAESNSEEEYYTSGDEFPTGYLPRYAALPSINDQKVARYRETVYFWGTVGCFMTSVVLIAIASMLLSAGRHKARLEVDAGVTVGIVTSLSASFGGLGLYMLRKDCLSLWHRAAVWVVFLGTLVLDMMLLVLVMEW